MAYIESVRGNEKIRPGCWNCEKPAGGFQWRVIHSKTWYSNEKN